MKIESQSSLSPASSKTSPQSTLQSPVESKVLPGKVSLLEFGDYECPLSAAIAPLILSLREEYQQKIMYEFKYFPRVDLHPHALMAAEVAEVARRQGKWEEMHRVLFANSSCLTPERVARLAGAVGLDLGRFAEDWTEHVGLHHIQCDFHEGLKRGVLQTPSFFINGCELPFDGNVESMILKIRQNLSREAESVRSPFLN